MPFILRGVTLYGIDSVMAAMPKRLTAWEHLANDLDLELLETMINEISLGEVIDIAPKVLAGEITGRILVDVNA